MESSYSTLDVTMQDSLLRHYTAPPGPARTLLDNYYSALTTDLPEALSPLFPLLLSVEVQPNSSHASVWCSMLQIVRRAGGFSWCLCVKRLQVYSHNV